jgi:predicted metal-binding protein
MADDIAASVAHLALQEGATHARVRATAGLCVEETVRQNCLVNYCGKSGRSWSCPPHVGELAALGARLLAYPQGAVLQSVSPLEDSWDFEGMTEAARSHNRMVRAVAEQLAARHPSLEILALGAGSCDWCAECTCPAAPCRCPERAVSSVEAQGLDINALVTSVGLAYINGMDTVSYVGMVLWK